MTPTGPETPQGKAKRGNMHPKQFYYGNNVHDGHYDANGNWNNYPPLIKYDANMYADYTGPGVPYGAASPAGGGPYGWG